MYFDDIEFFINGNIDNKKNKLVSSIEGFNRGNSFNNEYVPYKNIKVKDIKASSEEENLLLKIESLEFTLNDLALYLDLHPEDTLVFEAFKEAVEKYKDYLDRYERIYKPLNLDSVYKDTYEFYKNPWPWDNDGGIKYV